MQRRLNQCIINLASSDREWILTFIEVHEHTYSNPIGSGVKETIRMRRAVKSEKNLTKSVETEIAKTGRR